MAAEKHPSVPGSFYKIGPIYYYDLASRIGRLRVSTGQIHLDDAVAWVLARPFGNVLKTKKMELTHTFVAKLVHQAKNNAKAKGMLFKLTLEDFYRLWERAQGYCEVSGLPFSMEGVEGARRKPYAPSIDRIVAVRGYEPDNCRLVCASVNLAMNDFGEEVLRKIAFSLVSLRDKTLARVKSAPQHETEEVASA